MSGFRLTAGLKMYNALTHATLISPATTPIVTALFQLSNRNPTRTVGTDCQYIKIAMKEMMRACLTKSV
jgi:hypothetical protein